MKSNQYIILFILFLAVNITSISSQEDNAMQLAQPSAEHELLKKLEGTWNIELKYDMGGGMMMDGKGIGSSKMILGGRFLQSDAATEAMGMKVTSMSIMGYDRRINKYTLYGIDEMGTYSIDASGDYNAADKKLVLKGSVMDPTAMTTDMQDFRFEYIFVSDTEIKIDLFFARPDGTDWNLMQMKMTK